MGATTTERSQQPCRHPLIDQIGSLTQKTCTDVKIHLGSQFLKYIFIVKTMRIPACLRPQIRKRHSDSHELSELRVKKALVAKTYKHNDRTRYLLDLDGYVVRNVNINHVQVGSGGTAHGCQPNLRMP